MDDIVEAIVSRYADMISASLDVINDGCDPRTGLSQKVLKYDIPSPHCSAKIDVNGCQELMNKCIEQWYKVRQEDRPEYKDPNIYFMHGADQSKRRLLVPFEQGLLGRCKSVDLLPAQTAGLGNVRRPDAVVIRACGKLVRNVETQEEYMARYAAQYGEGTKIPMPDWLMMRQPLYGAQILRGRWGREKLARTEASGSMASSKKSLTK